MIKSHVNLAKIKLHSTYTTHGLISCKVREPTNKAGMKTKVCSRLAFLQKATVPATMGTQKVTGVSSKDQLR